MSERALIRRAQAGDTRACEVLVRLYAPMVQRGCREFFFAGAAHDDVLQEGFVGLLSAIRDFDADGDWEFPSFAFTCIRRMVMTGVNSHSRQKHRPLNDSERVARSPEDGQEIQVVDLLTDTLGRDPALVALEREELNELVGRFATLTALERRAVIGVIDGKTYCEIEGVPAGAKPKRIDNAVSRARAKLRDAA